MAHTPRSPGGEARGASGRRGAGRAWPEEVRTLAPDRDEEGALAAAVGEGCGLLLDVTAMTPAHTRQLTRLAGRVGSAVVLSSGAVYEDERGRSFATQREPDGFPRYPVPVPETQRTVEPGDADYGTRKALMERELLALGERMPVAPPEDEPMLGMTPWSLPHPMVYDMAAAERELGYRAVTTYEESLPETVEWLAARLRGRDWREAFPKMVRNYDPMGELFDYAAEDRRLARRP